MSFVRMSIVLVVMSYCLIQLRALTCDMDETYDSVNRETTPWPKCICEWEDYSTQPEEDVIYSTYFVKKCWLCTCGSDARGNYHSCTLESNAVATAQDWNLFECPRTTKCVDTAGEHYAFDGWFADTSGECTTYCYCTGKGQKVCETGWSEILSSSNAELTQSFLNECGEGIEDCLDDPSRLFTTDYGSSCELCPKCNCGSHAVGSQWFTEYEARYDDSRLHCAMCECMDGRQNYANCTFIDSYVAGNGQCAPTTSLSCHMDAYGLELEKDGINSIITHQSCYSQSPKQWCAWTPHETFPDAYTWGCASDVLNMWCEAYGIEDGCITYNILQQTGCSYDSDSTKVEMKHLYCCNRDDYCNFVEENESSCTVSAELTSAVRDLMDCFYGDRLYDPYFCDRDTTSVTCGGIAALYGLRNKCECTYLADIYSKVGIEWKTFLQKEIDQYSSEASEWNEVLGCNIDLKCDLATGTASNEGTDRDNAFRNMYIFISIIFTMITFVCF